MTVLVYAGDGQFSRQDDLYNPAEGQRVIKEWLRAGGRFSASPESLGMR